MKSRFFRALVVCAALLSLVIDRADTVRAVSNTIVISEFRVRGTSGGNDEFVELYNASSNPVIIGGWTMRGSNTAGTTGIRATVPPGITLAPGCFYLFTNSAAAGYSGAVPGNQNYTTGITDDGGVAVFDSLSAIVDQVGMSTGSAYKEGTTLPNLGTSNQNRSLERKPGGTAGNATDTDNNATDFVLISPSNPQNLSSTCIISTQSTNPSGTLQASKTLLVPGESVTLTATVTAGTNPSSTGLAVTANLSAIGLGTATFFDDGVQGGDAIAGDSTFTFTGAIPGSQPASSQSVTATITDSQARTGTTFPPVTISVQAASTSPVGSGSATPPSVPAGGTTLLSVNVTPGTNPASSGITVTGDLSAIGGSTSQVFQAGAGNAFTFSATVAQSTPAGAKTLPITVADAQSRGSVLNLSLGVTAPLANSTIVIGQVYGGGGNVGATYRNDYVQLYNRGTTTVDITGWSLQYASAAGTNWDNRLPLGGPIGPGEYYLIALGSGGAVGAALPVANLSFDTNISATTGKIALVDNYDILTDNCPAADPAMKDFVGYGGGATCREGAANAPAPSSTTALFRQGFGFIDTNENGSDFVTGTPAPTQTAPIVELGPQVLSTDPRWTSTTAPRDATIEIEFTEPVDVFGAWFDISCVSTGGHNDATTAANGNSRHITPNINFQPGEECTVRIVKNQISDTDTDDSAANTDQLPADYVWTFTVAAAGAPPPYTPDVHLTMGNPTGAVEDINQPDNYLMSKAEYALSYDRDLGRPNWVSWHLTAEWFGALTRVDTFRPDPRVLPEWYRVQSFDFQSSGFDRGHMVPNADRDHENSIPINQATYLMSNIVAQAPDNNQGPWANLENYLRTLVGTRSAPTNEIYIVAGPLGAGGAGSNGPFTTLANGHVTVPAYTWKVALVLPHGNNDVSRVTCSARTIAVVMPNVQGIRTSNTNDWMNYLTTVDAVETLTGYDFFSNVPQKIQNCIQVGLNGDNPEAQEITFAPIGVHHFGDADFAVDATASSGLGVSLSVISGPATIVNGVIDLTGAGTVTIRATQPGNDDFARAVPVDRTFTVEKASPAFSNVTSTTIEAGTATTTVGGIVSFGALVPTGTVTITLNGVSQTTAVGPGGSFSASFATASLAPSGTPYPVGYAYPGDTNFTSVAGVGSVRVVDTTDPSIGGVSASPSVLSPPNHKMIDITIAYQVTDVTGAPVCSLSVSSNEAIDGQGDGNTSVDWQVLGPHRVQLRAERAGGGSGRIYEITIRCPDGSGNIGLATTTVSVPK